MIAHPALLVLTWDDGDPSVFFLSSLELTTQLLHLHFELSELPLKILIHAVILVLHFGVFFGVFFGVSLGVFFGVSTLVFIAQTWTRVMRYIKAVQIIRRIEQEECEA